MNVPNKLTISRFILTVAFLIVFFSRVKYHETISLFIFGIASLTDYFDGQIARRDKLITNFGILMDPLADKVLICSVFIAFVDRAPRPAIGEGVPWMYAWMVVIVVARELAITGLRLLAASKNIVLAAEKFGKHKTISQIICILAILVAGSYKQWGAFGEAVFGCVLLGNEPWVIYFTELSKWIATILTAFSGCMYLWKNRALYLDDL